MILKAVVIIVLILALAIVGLRLLEAGKVISCDILRDKLGAVGSWMFPLN